MDPQSVSNGRSSVPKGRRSSKGPSKVQASSAANPNNSTLGNLKPELQGDNAKLREPSRKVPVKQAWAPPSSESRSIYSPAHPGPLLPPVGKAKPKKKGTSSRLFRAKDGSSMIMVDNELSKDFGRAEDHIFLPDLVKLRKKFEEADVNGDGTLDEEEFLAVFNKLFDLEGKKEDEILTFFNKIDYNCDNHIDWDEFCTYMYLEYQERDMVSHRQKTVTFHTPAQTTTSNPHNDSLCRIAHLLDGSLVTCSADGVLCFWASDYSPKRVRKTEVGHIGKPKWVTDMALCIPQSKIMLTTGDREVQFYEMMNFEPYCQLRRLESVPLRVAFWYNPDQHSECIILIGDREGTLTVITTDNIQEAFKHWKLGPKTDDGMPTYSVENLSTEDGLGTSVYRWKLHSNWVTEVHYFPSLRCFASCSSDPLASLVLGSPTGSTQVDALLQTSRQLSVVSSTERGHLSSGRPKSALPAKNRMRGDQRVFRVAKGVSTVDYCHKNNALVTGSTDQIIRIWNPFINTKPIAHLFGQGAPVFSVKVDPEENRIFSIGNDNTVKVWHTVDYTCLCTVIQGAHKVLSTVQTFHFNPINHLIALGTDQLSILKLVVKKVGRTNITQSHTHPITAIKYSHCFDQIVTACEGAILKVWNIFTGEKVFEYSSDLGVDVGVSALDVDLAGKRVVTGGQNGQIKVWNYNNGQCVRVLDKGNSSEVTDIRFICINNNKYIIAVGWDRKVSLFPDTASKHMQAHQLVKPVEAWSNASEHAHSEDILCVAFGSPHLMATASFDGEIIVWSVISCHALSHLKAPIPKDTSAVPGSEAVHKLLFLDTRSKSRTAATLVASGPAGYIHLWNMYKRGGPMGRFRASSSTVTAMVVDSKDSVLITAESQGHICVWSITGYCTVTKPTKPPRRAALWKAHSDTVTCIELIESRNVIASSASDGSVRLWTLAGHYIGSFGQDKLWDLGEPSSYQHPLPPKDIRIDPIQSEEEQNTDSLRSVLDAPDDGDSLEVSQLSELQKDSKKSIKSEKEGCSDGTRVMDESEKGNDDVLLRSHISMGVPIGQSSAGKRLRHLRSNSAAEKRPGRSPTGVYTSLPYQPLSEEAHFKKIINHFAPIRGHS